MLSWDKTVSKAFLESERASYWSEYWQAKKDAVSRLEPNKRRGILNSTVSAWLDEAIPQTRMLESLGFAARDPKDMGFGFPGTGVGGFTSQELVNGLLRGILLYDVLIWDATYFERDLFHEESDKRYYQARKQGVDSVIELMRNGLLYPYNFFEDTTVEEEMAEDTLIAYVAEDPEIQKIVKSWELDDVQDADEILLAYVRHLDFSRKLDASIISTRRERELYEQILSHFASGLSDTSAHVVLEDMFSTNVPYFYVEDLELLRKFAKENCVRHFRKKVWQIVQEKLQNPHEIILELMTELDLARKQLAELARTLSLAKLVWGIVTIATTPILPAYPFPYSLAIPSFSLASREATAKIAEYCGTRKYRWVFAVDELRKLSNPK